MAHTSCMLGKQSYMHASAYTCPRCRERARTHKCVTHCFSMATVVTWTRLNSRVPVLSNDNLVVRKVITRLWKFKYPYKLPLWSLKAIEPLCLPDCLSGSISIFETPRASYIYIVDEDWQGTASLWFKWKNWSEKFSIDGEECLSIQCEGYRVQQRIVRIVHDTCYRCEWCKWYIALEEVVQLWMGRKVTGSSETGVKGV